MESQHIVHSENELNLSVENICVAFKQNEQACLLLTLP